MENQQLLFRGKVHRDDAVKAFIAARLKFENLNTIKMTDLRDYGYPEEDLELLDSVIALECLKPIRDRSSLKVLREFKLQRREQIKNTKKTVPFSREEAKERKQKIQLGLPVKVNAYWPNIIVGEKKYYILCSIGIGELPDIQRLFRLRDGEDNCYANVIVSIAVDDLGKIAKSIIAIRGISRNESAGLIRSLFGSFNNGSGIRGRWIKDENKMTLICIAGDKMGYEELINKTKICVESTCEN